MELISVVLPTYNEEESINQFYKELKKNTDLLKKNYNFELIFINDGSKDTTEQLLSQIQKIDNAVRIINFEQNFGHQSAISAGMDYAHGDIVITMDTDLQDPPGVIIEMLKKYKEGFDVVHGVRADRKDGFFKNLSAHIFYKLFRLMSGYGAIENTADFKLINNKIKEKLNANPSSKSFLRGSIAKYGQNQARIFYTRPERFAGKSKYSLIKMTQLALDGFKFAINPDLLKPPKYEIRSIIEN